MSAWRSARCWNPARACRRAWLGVPAPGSSSCLAGIPKDKACQLQDGLGSHGAPCFTGEDTGLGSLDEESQN